MISSRSHPLVKRLRDVRDGRDKRSVFVEGVRLAEELLSAGWTPVEACAGPSLPAGNKLLARLAVLKTPLASLSDDVMRYVSALDAPPGVILLARRPAPPSLASLISGRKNPLLVFLEGLQSPGNAGAVVRTAEAAGAAAVLQDVGGTDLYGPKALRASAGSAFRLPVLMDVPFSETVEQMENAGVRCVAADARGERAHTEWDWTRPTTLVLGSETGRGTDAATRNLPSVKIAMAPPVESLNAAVAAGILLFEAARQRGNRPLKNPPPAPGKAELRR